MNGIVAIAPDDVPIEMYLEQHDDKDTLIPLVKHPRLRVHWVARRDEKSLAEAIESRDWSDWYVWATPEAATLKHVRRRLRDEFGFLKSAIHAQAYWSAGRAMGIRRGDEPDATVAAAPLPDDRQGESVAAHRCGSTLRRILAAAARGRGVAHPR